MFTLHVNRSGDEDNDPYFEDSEVMTESLPGPVPDPPHDPISETGRLPGHDPSSDNSG